MSGFDPKLHVLVADPSSHMAALVVAMLHSLRIRPAEAMIEPSQIAAELGRRAFDLVLMDEQLAGGDDFSLIRALRHAEGHPNRLTPVIMMAAGPDARMIAAARDAGVTEFLRKPFSAAHIRQRLEGLQQAPRPFVEADDYAGPDRRRRAAPGDARRRRSDNEAS